MEKKLNEQSTPTINSKSAEEGGKAKFEDPDKQYMGEKFKADNEPLETRAGLVELEYTEQSTKY